MARMLTRIALIVVLIVQCYMAWAIYRIIEVDEKVLLLIDKVLREPLQQKQQKPFVPIHL